MRPPDPAPRHRTPSGWADDRLMHAYDLIHAAMSDHMARGERLPELRTLLCDLEKGDDAIGELLDARVE